MQELTRQEKKHAKDFAVAIVHAAMKCITPREFDAAVREVYKLCASNADVLEMQAVPEDDFEDMLAAMPRGDDLVN